MNFFARNHVQPFRPLRGGIAIMNGNVRLFGTLGCIATSDGLDRWIVSAFHVLVGRNRVAVAGEEVFQPAVGASELPIARTDAARADSGLDIAAAQVLTGVAAVSDVLGIGLLQRFAAPQIGMRVVKSGIATGITEGLVTDVVGSRVTIEPLGGYPSKYELSSVSDSGAVWVEQDSGAAVALHVAGNDTGQEISVAVPMPTVLQVLQLRL